MGRLERAAYMMDTRDVAKRLLGCTLVRTRDGVRLAGTIVETEAYMGPDDLGAHSARGRTKRTEAMFGPPGHAYIYLIYGIHHCVNAVTQSEGIPHAVLIRAIEPVDGVALMRELRRNTRTGALPARDTDIADGPGKLCQALDISRKLYGTDIVSGGDLWIEAGELLSADKIGISPRIGVDYAGEWAEKPLRFWIRDNPHVSQ